MAAAWSGQRWCPWQVTPIGRFLIGVLRLEWASGPSAVLRRSLGEEASGVLVGVGDRATILATDQPSSAGRNCWRWLRGPSGPAVVMRSEQIRRGAPTMLRISAPSWASASSATTSAVAVGISGPDRVQRRPGRARGAPLAAMATPAVWPVNSANPSGNIGGRPVTKTSPVSSSGGVRRSRGSGGLGHRGRRTEGGFRPDPVASGRAQPCHGPLSVMESFIDGVRWLRCPSGPPGRLGEHCHPIVGGFPTARR